MLAAELEDASLHLGAVLSAGAACGHSASMAQPRAHPKHVESTTLASLPYFLYGHRMNCEHCSLFRGGRMEDLEEQCVT